MDIGTLGVYVCLFFALYFEVFLLLSFLEQKPTKKTSTKPEFYPTVSMLVPCWNEEGTIAATLDSLLALGLSYFLNLKAKGNVLFYGEVRKKRHFLEYDRDFSPLRRQ